MVYNGNFDDILEDCLIEDLEWLKEEFDFLFKSRNHKFTEKDKQLADKIIKNFLDKINISDNNRIDNILTENLRIIEFDYPEFF